jgi:ABC-type branched-subunit amino acid transport system substrate-binding protein
MRARRIVSLLTITLLSVVACRGAEAPLATVGPIKTGVGVEGQTIKLGELTPLTGPIAVIGKPLTRGHEVYFQYVNDVLGGVGKNLPKEQRYKIELVTLDTQYLNDVHVQQYNAVKDKVAAIAQSLGTPQTKAILQQVREDKILTGAATLASDWFKEKYVVANGAPYIAQVANAVQYLKDKGVQPKIGLIYQDDDYGAEGVVGLEYATKAVGFTIAARASYKATDTEFTAQVNTMKQAGVDHVFLTTTPTATGRLLGAAAALSYAPRWIGNSPAWLGALVGTKEKPSPLVPYMQQTLWVVTDQGCGWADVGAGCEGSKLMQDNLAKYAKDQPPDYFFSFGYTQAMGMHAILERAVELRDLTRDGLARAFESVKTIDSGGLRYAAPGTGAVAGFGATCQEKVGMTSSTIWKIDTTQPIALASVANVDSKLAKDYKYCG